MICIGKIEWLRYFALCFFLQYKAENRISAAEAMHHPYFEDLGTEIKNLSDGEYFLIFYLVKLLCNLIKCKFHCRRTGTRKKS